jgi:dTDP-4-dehydrorhamnose reductase
MKVLILGVTGMLGSTLFKRLSQDPQHDVWGTLRSESARGFFAEVVRARLIDSIDVLDQKNLVKVMNRVRPEMVINCTGLIKQLAAVNDPLSALPINSMFPHQLAGLCELLGARMIQLSSDCVFSGHKGNYCETDVSDAEDLYGKSKFMGEVHNLPHVITLRTSGIGHELNSQNGLLEWFLFQQEQIKGYANAIYSGLPSVELARVIRDFVLPHSELNGLYHVSAKPITKLDLLKLVAKIYGKEIKIAPDESLAIDRSLNSERFMRATGYVSADWPELIKLMCDSR